MHIFLEARVLAVLFRLFALIGLLALAGLLWLKFDTQTKQQVAFLDEVIDDAYTVLQSEKEAQWKDISDKKSAFNDVFDANEQIPDGDENLLSSRSRSIGHIRAEYLQKSRLQRSSRFLCKRIWTRFIILGF